MSDKEIVFGLLKRLPDTVSLQHIAQEIKFIAGVREGLEEVERGEGVEIDQGERMIEPWSVN